MQKLQLQVSDEVIGKYAILGDPDLLVISVDMASISKTRSISFCFGITHQESNKFFQSFTFQWSSVLQGNFYVVINSICQDNSEISIR